MFCANVRMQAAAEGAAASVLGHEGQGCQTVGTSCRAAWPSAWWPASGGRHRWARTPSLPGDLCCSAAVVRKQGCLCSLVSLSRPPFQGCAEDLLYLLLELFPCIRASDDGCRALCLQHYSILASPHGRAACGIAVLYPHFKAQEPKRDPEGTVAIRTHSTGHPIFSEHLWCARCCYGGRNRERDKRGEALLWGSVW